MSKRYGMTIDLNRCVGCQTCTVACKHANDTLPEVQWRKVLDVETGTFPDVQRLFLVTGCQHCADPPCVPVCPTGATFQRDDGLVAMDYDACIGCGYCAVACPYQARTIMHDQRWFYGEPTRQEEAVKHEERIGVAQKCSFCVERIDEAEQTGKIPGLDLDVTPACAASCIAQAIQFGDFKDENSVVSQLVAEGPSFQMHQELGTDPQIRYLYQTPAVPGREGEADPDPHGDPANALTGELQTFWDLRAAMNFSLGGMGSGLIGASWLTSKLLGGLPPAVDRLAMACGALLIALGLFSVFLEIGRKSRFLYALRRPGTSWMTREIYVVAALYPCLAVSWWMGDGLWRDAAGVLALLFLFCQGKILNLAKGIPAWRAQAIPNLFMTTGLVEGFGLLCMGLAVMQWADPELEQLGVVRLVSLLGFGLAMSGGFTWKRYLRHAQLEGMGPLAIGVLRQATPGIHVFAHLLPVLLLGGTFILISTMPVHPVVYLLGGLSAVVGGVWCKILVITRASYQQGFSLPRKPQRGSGEMAAPRRMQGVVAE